MFPPSSQAVIQDTEAHADNTPQSLLLLEGDMALAGFAEQLFNASERLYEASCDVPTLLAPIAFAGAHIQHLESRVRAFP